MAKETIKVPDIGGAENVDVIELCVGPGDVVSAEDSLIVLESDKASMDVPSPMDGKVIKLLVSEGSTVSEGDAIAEIETDAAAEPEAPAPQTAQAEPAPAPVSAPAAPTETKTAVASDVPVNVPDIGGAEGVDVIEVCVAVGDEVAEGDSLIVLESDKASMEVPSPQSGKVTSISINEGDKVSMGDAILVLASSAGEAVTAEPQNEVAQAPAAAPAVNEEAPSAIVSSGPIDVNVPDIGGSEDVSVIEICIAEGDEVSEGDSLIVLESDKASMEVPSPASGKVMELKIKEGDTASEGTPILVLEAFSAAPASAPAPAPQPAKSAPAPAKPQAPKTSNELHPQEITKNTKDVYAGPAVRQLARQLGVDLAQVKASGPRGRIVKDDVKAYVKSVMQKGPAKAAVATSGSGIPPIPAVDFGQFGEIETVKMSKIQKVTALNMSRNWLNVPHVTQFDDADITDMEEFRKSMKAQAEKAGVKLTPLAFLIKACASALVAEPKFNVSLHSDGEQLVKKKYVHIGIAVDTPNGLMVPVVRDADKKGLFQLAEESMALAKKARDGKLMPRDMQGGCFTISSLGPIGGKGFTPIVNAPEVAILGVSKAEIKPVWDGKAFIPRQMLPLCLSYDHRAINGADAGKFFTYLSSVLGDLRKLLV